MSDFFEQVSRQILIGGDSLQPLLPPRFAPIQDLHLPPPQALPQPVDTSLWVQPPSEEGAAGHCLWPASWVPLVRTLGAAPLPSFRQMSQPSVSHGEEIMSDLMDHTRLGLGTPVAMVESYDLHPLGLADEAEPNLSFGSSALLASVEEPVQTGAARGEAMAPVMQHAPEATTTQTIPRPDPKNAEAAPFHQQSTTPTAAQPQTRQSQAPPLPSVAPADQVKDTSFSPASLAASLGSAPFHQQSTTPTAAQPQTRQSQVPPLPSVAPADQVKDTSFSPASLAASLGSAQPRRASESTAPTGNADNAMTIVQRQPDIITEPVPAIPGDVSVKPAAAPSITSLLPSTQTGGMPLAEAAMAPTQVTVEPSINDATNVHVSGAASTPTETTSLQLTRPMLARQHNEPSQSLVRPLSTRLSTAQPADPPTARQEQTGAPSVGAMIPGSQMKPMSPDFPPDRSTMSIDEAGPQIEQLTGVRFSQLAPIGQAMTQHPSWATPTRHSAPSNFEVTGSVETNADESAMAIRTRPGENQGLFILPLLRPANVGQPPASTPTPYGEAAGGLVASGQGEDSEPVSQLRSPAKSTGPLTVRITIGRIEVRTTTTPPPAPRRRTAQPGLSLDSYLNQR